MSDTFPCSAAGTMEMGLTKAPGPHSAPGSIINSCPFSLTVSPVSADRHVLFSSHERQWPVHAFSHLPSGERFAGLRVTLDHEPQGCPHGPPPHEPCAAVFRSLLTLPSTFHHGHDHVQRRSRGLRVW